MMLRTCGIVLGLLGCAPEPLVLHLDNATEAERQATTDAIARMNPYARLGRNITLAATPLSGIYTLSFVERIPTKDGDMLGRECTKEGQDCPRARFIRVLRGMDTDLLVQVIAHEIGHAWRLPHLPPRAMMASGTGVASPFFTAVDQAVCIDKGECAKTPMAPPPLPPASPEAKALAPSRRID